LYIVILLRYISISVTLALQVSS